MKKVLIVVAALAAFASCQKDSKLVDPTKKYEIESETIAAPEKTENAMVIKLATPPSPVLSNIELTESGMFLAYTDSKLISKATPLDAVDILTGKYTVSDDFISLDAKGSTVKIPAKKAADITGISVDGKDYDASASSMPAASGVTETGLCRTWYPTGFHATLITKDQVLYNKESKTVMDLQKDLMTYVLGKEPGAKDLLFNAELIDLIFTKNHTAVVEMTGDFKEGCKWTLEGEKICFELNGYKVSATPYFKAGTPNTMNIIVDIKASDYEIPTEYKVNIDLKGRLVLTMVDAK